MTVSIFGLTANNVRDHHFPHLDAWSASSSPSTTTVTEAIAEEAGVLAGALTLENIDASTITNATSGAYVQCRKVLRMQVAIRIARDMTGQNPELLKAWSTAVDVWYKGLDEGGASFLGDGAAAVGESDPDGPTSHITTFGLTQDTPSAMSTVVPRLRRDDQL